MKITVLKASLLLSVVFAVLCIVLVDSTIGAAAQGAGSLMGDVQNGAGKVMHGVLVKAKTGGKVVTVLSQLDGRFTFARLEPGNYVVRAERRGFIAESQDIVVPTAKPLRFTLKPGPTDPSNLSVRDLEKVLPDSPYKATVLRCDNCHSWSGLTSQKTYRIPTLIYGIRLMRSRGYAGLPSSSTKFTDEDIPKMAEYLYASFGPDAKLPLDQLSADPIDERGLNIKYVTFDIPSNSPMPHTAFPDGHGNVWFTEYGSGKIGVVNVSTGRIEEFKVPSRVPPSPHGLTLDRFGNVWFAEQTAAQIGRFDPKTKAFKEYPVPLPPSRPGELVAAGYGPHSVTADRRGHIWFTASLSPNLRRLDPETGEVVTYFIYKELGKASQYGIEYDAKNNRVWYAGIGFNEVGYVDAETGKVTRFSMLTSDSGPRRVHIDSHGVAWSNLYNVSKIARIDPSTGRVTEWDLPGPRDGYPYAAGLDAKGRMWTASAKDDLLYMFDPKTERITTYPLPMKGAGMRDFYVDEKGWMWGAMWGRNQVIGFALDEK